PDGDLGRRPLPRQVPVHPRDVARRGRHRRSRRRQRVRAGRARGRAAGPPGPERLAGVLVARRDGLGPHRASAGSPAPRRAGYRGASAGVDQRSRRGRGRIRMTCAGTPATTALSGTSLVTTALVPTIALSPIVTPRRTHAPYPIQTLWPTRTSRLWMPCSRTGR